MCITQSVGAGGNNDKGDLHTLQLLPNMNSGRGEFVCAVVTKMAAGAVTALPGTRPSKT